MDDRNGAGFQGGYITRLVQKCIMLLFCICFVCMVLAGVEKFDIIYKTINL